MGQPRRVRGHLNVHAVIDEIHHVLRMGFGLHAAAHVAESLQRVAVLHDEPGDDCVKRPLAGSDDVRALGGPAKRQYRDSAERSRKGDTVAPPPYTENTLWMSDTMLPQRSAVVR